MRIFSLFFCMLAFIVMPAVAQTDYVQVEVISLTPKADKVDLFKKAVAAHNKKYHPANGNYRVNVSYIVSGPNSGSYLWIMGPTTWTQMDSRPGKGEHDTDWDKNVMPHVQTAGAASYWRLNRNASYTPEGLTVTKNRVRFNETKVGQQDRFIEQMKKIAEVYKQKKYNVSFEVWVHYGATDGPNVVSINGFPNWAALDSNVNFVRDYEEVHGANSWARFLEEIDLSVDRSKTVDQILESVPELGG